MRPYSDTNALTRLYLQLPDALEAGSLFRSIVVASQRVPITWLHRAEFANAIELHVFQGRQGGGQIRITPEQASFAHGMFAEDLHAAEFCRAVEIDPADLVREVEHLAQRYTARHGFRVYDLMHVASAVLLGCDRFWSYDAKAERLAKLEGLSIR